VSTLLRWFFEAELHFGTKSILWRELIGNAFGLASAILGMRRKVGAWPIGMVGNAILFTVFLGNSILDNGDRPALLGQAGRQVLFFVVSAYGWYRWQRTRNRSADNVAVVPRWATWSERLYLALGAVAFYVAAYSVIAALGSWKVWADTAIFTGSALATFAMARGFIEFWLVWIAVDALGLWLLIPAGYYPTAVMYGFYGVFVVWGFITWMRIGRREAAQASG
jgi:nicotinamide mononucleotide transporter